MLIDKVTITVKAGSGGNGRVSFKHLPGNYKGGPDGGNGGNGGDVYFVGEDNILGLKDFRFKKEIKGIDGVPGGKSNLYGKNGEDISVKLPLGTLISDIDSGEEWEIVSSEMLLIAKGGKGGRGNNEFKSATVQAPRYAEKGELGQTRTLQLELKIIADVGLIGLPNAGKSSLLSVLTNAHPKIGNYPFTTLEPNIGMMGQITLADIPGLIEGAHLGKGLGTEFLRHIEKTQLLVHCISVENDNVVEAYQAIREELKAYSSSLTQKPEIILLTKTDLVSADELKAKLDQLQQTKNKIFSLSLYDDASVQTVYNLLEKSVAKAS